MKTSTKLLIMLFLSIPISMFIFNWLLVKEYETGNLKLRWGSFPRESKERKLPAFKHVVMDGRLHQKNGILTLYGRVLDVEPAGENQQSGLMINPEFEKSVITKVVNDTLYISYFKEKVDDDGYIPYELHHLELRAQKIKSLNFSHGNYVIRSLNADSIKVRTNNASVDVNNIKAESLNANVGEASTIRIYSNNKFKELQYSINHGSGSLELDPHIADTYKPGKVHRNARLSLTGKASEMEKYITP